MCGKPRKCPPKGSPISCCPDRAGDTQPKCLTRSQKRILGPVGRRSAQQGTDPFLGSLPEFASRCPEFCRLIVESSGGTVWIISVHRGVTAMHTILRLPDVKRSAQHNLSARCARHFS
jgi:hypothetical protein